MSEENQHLVNREIDYLNEKGLLRSVKSSFGIHAVTGITADGRDELESNS